MKRTALIRRTPLRRISDRRMQELDSYRWKREEFLEAHPFCAVWLVEHGISEEDAIRKNGLLDSGLTISRSTEIHHANKRRGDSLLQKEYWIAVSADGHRAIEDRKDLARRAGFLFDC